MFDTVIKKGTVVTPKDTFRGDILISQGKIQAIAAPDSEFEAKETYDASGMHVFPGFIDTHVHSRDGGATHKEDFYHSTLAAACGGVTTLFEMPNAVPAVINRDSFREQRENLSSKAFIDFGMWGLSLGELNNRNLPELESEGVVGFKFFWGYAIRRDNYNLVYNPAPGDTNIIEPLSDGEVLTIFEEVAKTNREIAIHAENASIIREQTRKISPSRYPNAYEALLDQRPVLAEVATVQLAIEFARATNARLHILHVTAAPVVDLIRIAQKEGVRVTGETCPHYLVLTADRYNTAGNMMKGYPPVRRQEDQDRLWEGLRDGTLGHVCSDHAPHTAEEKSGDLFKAPAGMCGVETLVPVMADAVSRGKLTVNQLSLVLSENPARHYGLYPMKGSLLPGTDADITVIDFQAVRMFHAGDLHSVSKVTAYDGMMLQGIPKATFLRGIRIAENGQPCTERKYGQFLPVRG